MTEEDKITEGVAIEVNGKIIIEMTTNEDIKYWLNIQYHPKNKSIRGYEVKYPYRSVTNMIAVLKKVLYGSVRFDRYGRVWIEE